MVRRPYTGVRDPQAEFDALASYRQALIRMMTQCRPFGPDYVVLYEAQQALDRAAEHFTKTPRYYTKDFGGHR
jgi:hypothetical protein